MPQLVFPLTLLLSFAAIASTSGWAASNDELVVVRSHAACKDTATVEQFEKFEKDDDDQSYKKLYIAKGATRECIFLNAGEILREGATRNGRWVCIKELSPGAECYWTPSTVVKHR